MKLHIGTKQVTATPMTRGDYNAYRGWTLPADEDGSDAGYLVEYLDGGKPNDSRHTGYISWSPKEQFDNAYRPTTGMSFGLAIEALKGGAHVARTSWNGRGQWVSHMQSGVCHDIDTGEEFEVSEFLAIKTVDGRIVPWVASQTDTLADDWHIVE